MRDQLIKEGKKREKIFSLRGLKAVLQSLCNPPNLEKLRFC